MYVLMVVFMSNACSGLGHRANLCSESNHENDDDDAADVDGTEGEEEQGKVDSSRVCKR